MSYESWVTILLAAITAILTAVTLIVAIAGIGIAVVGIWGIRGIKIAARKKAEEAMSAKLAEYPQASEIIDLYRKQVAEMLELYRKSETRLEHFRQEYEQFQRRTEEANQILVRLSAAGAPAASNVTDSGENVADEESTPISASYPGEEGIRYDGDDGERKGSSGNADNATDPR